ncbi:MAG: F0F1 ATP synthase subunit delta [Patescibacteria group bacterium]
MLAQWYAQALYDSIRDVSGKDAEKIFARFLDIVKRRGHTRLLNRVALLLRVQEEKDLWRSGVTLTIASEKDADRFGKRTAEFAESETDGKRTTRLCVDGTIIGGYRLRTSTTLLDDSYKRHLLDIYRLITTR